MSCYCFYKIYWHNNSWFEYGIIRTYLAAKFELYNFCNVAVTYCHLTVLIHTYLCNAMFKNSYYYICSANTNNNLLAMHKGFGSHMTQKSSNGQVTTTANDNLSCSLSTQIMFDAYGMYLLTYVKNSVLNFLVRITVNT